MKILVDIRMLEYSGIGVYIKKCLYEIINKSNNNYDFYFIVAENFNFNKYSWINKENCILSKSSIYSIRENIELLKLVPKDIDLLWIPHINIPILYKERMVVTIHDVFHLAHINQLPLLQKLYIKVISYFLKRNPQKIITVSNFSKSEIVKYLGIDSENIEITHNGVDLEWRKPDTSLPVTTKKKYFIYIGNVKPHKNLKNLILAFDSIKKDIPHDLIIVGKKDGFITEDKEMAKYVHSKEERVKFTGFIEDEDLRGYVKNAEAMIFPSFYEGFGLPPLEAMACGTPVIASNAASIPEVCGDAALYFDPYNPIDIAEKILSFISDKNLQKDLRDRGLKRSELFSWEKCAEQTIKIFEDVLAE